MLVRAVTTTITEKFKITPQSEVDSFGYSVSLSDNRTLVGTASFDRSTAVAYVYVFTAGVWTLEATLTPSEVQLNDTYGSAAVSLSGNRALIGAPQGFSKGSAYVFAFDGRAWDQTGHIFAPSEVTSGGNFGQSVSLSGRRALIGASEGNDNIGSAYLYRFDGAIWTEQEKLVACDGAPDDEFGFPFRSRGNGRLSGQAGRSPGNRGRPYVFGEL